MYYREDRGIDFLKFVGVFYRLHRVISQETKYPGDTGRRRYRNIDAFLPDYTASYPRREGSVKTGVAAFSET
jgi:hypothetical protein